METVDIQHWFKSTLARLKAFGRDTKRSPEFVWKTLLSLFVIGVLGSAIAAYFIFYASGDIKTAQFVAPRVRDILNIPEINAVLATYQQKKETLNDLVSAVPDFPSPDKGPAPKIEPPKTATSSATSTAKQPAP